MLCGQDGKTGITVVRKVSIEDTTHQYDSSIVAEDKPGFDTYHN